MLYLSLEKSLFLNKVHLNILNSFQLNVIKNKGFKPLLNASSRIHYFNFFSTFLAFIFRSFIDNSFQTLKLYTLSLILVRSLQDLQDLAMLKLEEEEDSTINKRSKKGLNNIKKSLNYKLNKLKVKNLDLETLEEEEEHEEEEEEYENSNSEEQEEDEEEYNNELSSSSSSNSLNSLSSTFSTNSYTILNKVASLSKEDNEVCILIKNKLRGLFISLYRQETNLYLFNSPIHSFFASKSIRENLSIRDSLDFSQYYSQFIYCS